MDKLNVSLKLIIKTIAPSVLAIALFAVAMFAVTIPYFKDNLVDKKKEIIEELTKNTVSVLDEYNTEVSQNLMTLEQAKKEAIQTIRNMRYGDALQDYFWITDMTPQMIMHPYRTDLEGIDLSNYEDPTGKKLFVESVKLVKTNNEGFIDYMWQWKNDPSRIVPKISFVKAYRPWGWIVGTGIYIEDVNEEVENITRKLVLILLIIVFVIAIIHFYILRKQLLLEQARQKANEQLQASREKYKKLVEASTDGTLLVRDNTIVFSNKTFLEMSGYKQNEVNGENIRGFFNESFIKFLSSPPAKTTNIEAKLLKQDGVFVDILVTMSNMKMADMEGFILIIKNIGRQKKVSEQLIANNVKYKKLAVLLKIGIFRAYNLSKLRIQEINTALKEICGQDITGESLYSILANKDDAEQIRSRLKDNSAIRKMIVEIKRPDKSIISVALSVAVVTDDTDEGTYVDGIIEDISQLRKLVKDSENLIIELQASLLVMNQPIKNLLKKFISCHMDDSIEKAAYLMVKEKYSAILVESKKEHFIGIITDKDLRERVVAGALDAKIPVVEVMSAPIITISDDTLIFEAIRTMQEKHIRHLVVKNQTGKISGLISNEELIHLQQASSSFILQEIRMAKYIEDLAFIYKRLPQLVSSFLHSGARSQTITRIISSVADEIINRLVLYAIDKFGQPPCKFSFITLGSEGRKEQSLATDQDNAIVFEDVESENSDETFSYFNKLGNFVCDRLNDIGYKYCNGDNMAKNPKWCQPLSVWKKYFSDWINHAEPKDVMHVSIFFDLRHTFGHHELAESLYTHINKELKSKSVFYFHLAQNVLSYKPPINFFGNIVTEGDAHPHSFDIKKVIMPIIGLARLYSLKAEIHESNTLNRLEGLNNKQVISQTEYDKLYHAYNYLMLQRLRNQSRQISNNKNPSNYININKLNEIDKATLKKIFSSISDFQSKISFEFGQKGV